MKKIVTQNIMFTSKYVLPNDIMLLYLYEVFYSFTFNEHHGIHEFKVF